jgi:tetratricopeptide (TPR) repeat protein
MRSRRLDSWKSIATYLGYSQRTVMRWHAERNLPVHRVPGGRRGSIFAYASELDSWLSSRSWPALEFAASPERNLGSPWTQRAQHLWEIRSEDNLNEIIEFYRAAIRLDGGNAASYAGLACALLASSSLDLIQGSIALLQAKTAVATALSLEPGLTEARCAEGWIAFWRQRDYAAAARCFQDVFEKKPNFSFGLSGQAWLYTITGERSRSIAMIETLLQESAFSTHSAMLACRIYFLNGEFRKTLHIATQATACRSAGLTISILEALAFLKIGEADKAIRCLQQQAAEFPENALIAGSLGYAYGTTGRYQDALHTYHLLQNMSERQIAGCAYPLAMAAAALGRNQEAIERLEQSCMEECFHALTLQIDPAFQSLRGDGGFERLLRQIRMPAANPSAPLFFTGKSAGI